MTEPRITAAVAGPKGAAFLSGVLGAGLRPDVVYSYPQKGDHSQSFSDIETQCGAAGIQLHRATRPRIRDTDWLFVVGWQYLLPELNDNVVVFHDSLLPKYRGYSPTVCALIAGERELGVTAFRPDGGMDTGPIYKQASIPVVYPCRIADALDSQARLMVEITIELTGALRSGVVIRPEPQDEEGASYSIWRDAEDYRIDFRWPADRVVRFIHAVGYPYAGALTRLDEDVRVLDAEQVPDLHFAERTPGKVWRIDEAGPVVICGQGMVRLTDIRTEHGDVVRLSALRSRFR